MWGKKALGEGGLKTFNCAIARCPLFASYTECIIQALGNSEDKGQNKARPQSKKKISNIPKYYSAAADPHFHVQNNSLSCVRGTYGT